MNSNPSNPSNPANSTNPTAQPVIELRNLSFTYARNNAQDKKGTGTFLSQAALEDINIAIENSEIVVLLGPSGCGKTTLCRCVTGVIPKIFSGTLTGELRVGTYTASATPTPTKPTPIMAPAPTTPTPHPSLGELSRMVGFVQQEPDHQIVMTTVEDDIAFGPENLMRPPTEIRATVDAVIDSVGLDGKALHAPHALSGGEKQRLAIGGVLAMEPRVLIFDEPASSLDARGRERFVAIVKQLKTQGVTVLIVEHDFEFLDFADRWILMKNGRVLANAAPASIPAHLLEDELWR